RLQTSPDTVIPRDIAAKLVRVWEILLKTENWFNKKTMKASVIFMMATALAVSLNPGRGAEMGAAPMGTPLSPGFYVGGVFRGVFIEDTNLKQLNGPASGTVSFDPGAGMSFK